MEGECGEDAAGVGFEGGSGQTGGFAGVGHFFNAAAPGVDVAGFETGGGEEGISWFGGMRAEEGFSGEVEPGCRCLVERKGSTAYLVSTFSLSPGRMETIDRGHDPTTHEQLWGALAGCFEFSKTHDYSDEIPPAWLEAFDG